MKKYTREEMEYEIKKALDEASERRYMHERIDALERRIYELDMRLEELRCKTDPGLKVANDCEAVRCV